MEIETEIELENLASWQYIFLEKACDLHKYREKILITWIWKPIHFNLLLLV